MSQTIFFEGIWGKLEQNLKVIFVFSVNTVVVSTFTVGLEFKCLTHVYNNRTNCLRSHPLNVIMLLRITLYQILIMYVTFLFLS